MPSSSLIALFALVLGASNALPWAGPEETGAYRVEEFSPRPTSAPSFELLKRDSVAVNVCGWIGGRSDSVARCGSGSFCVHDTIHGFIGCCATAGPCTDGVYTTCIHSGMDGWQSQGGLINNGVLSWYSSRISCLTHMLRGTVNLLRLVTKTHFPAISSSSIAEKAIPDRTCRLHTTDSLRTCGCKWCIQA